ncbi:hypothetical protein KJ780_03080, partial [Candidatus Micrarchaeota archaeon]|nr:hypothetical protein [Candidatus Micrarchaeota archaeon]
MDDEFIAMRVKNKNTQINLYNDDLFKQFRTPKECARYVKTSNDKVGILASLYRILQTSYYDEDRGRTFLGTGLNPANKMWENFLNGNATGACRDNAALVVHIAKMAGLDASAITFPTTNSSAHVIPA